MAYDNHRSTLWVTLTGSDELLGLHLRGTTVTSRTTYATVQQPNTVAVDNLTGELVVTGSPDSQTRDPKTGPQRARTDWVDPAMSPY